MSFTRSNANTDTIRNLPDYPSNSGYTAAQLKTAFDTAGEDLKTDLNGLMTELEGTSSAESLGAAAIADGDSSAANVQAKLEKIYEDLQGVALGDIPDGTITKAKMDATYAGTLAEKDGTVQTGLSAEMLNGKTEAQLKSAFLDSQNPSTLSFTQLLVTVSGTSETVTETQTFSSSGSRYYFILSSYECCKLLLFDAQTNKFVFATYLGNNPARTNQGAATFSFNVTSARLYRDYYADATVDLTGTYSGGTITFSATKHAKRDSDGDYHSAPAGTITIFEVGGKVA